MFGFVRIACGLVLILLLGVVAVVQMPHAPSDSEAGQAFTPFGPGGDAYSLPAHWAVVDPFTSRTPYLGNLWFRDFPAFATKVAYFRSRRASQELFVMWGDARELAPIHDAATSRWRGHPSIKEEPEQSTSIADGTVLSYRIATLESGGLGGDNVVFCLGAARVGESMLVVNGGGLATEFDRDALVELLRSIRLQH